MYRSCSRSQPVATLIKRRPSVGVPKCAVLLSSAVWLRRLMWLSLTPPPSLDRSCPWFGLWAEVKAARPLLLNLSRTSLRERHILCILCIFLYGTQDLGYYHINESSVLFTEYGLCNQLEHAVHCYGKTESLYVNGKLSQEVFPN